MLFFYSVLHADGRELSYLALSFKWSFPRCENPDLLQTADRLGSEYWKLQIISTIYCQQSLDS